MLSCLAESLQPGCAILSWREKEGAVSDPASVILISAKNLMEKWKEEA